MGTISEKWIKQYRLWIMRTSEGLAAISAICTHLGCTPRYLEQENKFKCPCHGSGYRGLDPSNPFPGIAGINFEGPAPRPLDLFPIEIVDGAVVVDTGNPINREQFDPSQETQA